MRAKSGSDKDRVKIMSPRKVKRVNITTHQFPIRLGVVATAEGGKCPSRDPLHSEPVVLAQERQKRPQGTLLQDIISANRAVNGDISQSPNCLFADINNRGGEQPDKLWDGICVDDYFGVMSGSGRNVG